MKEEVKKKWVEKLRSDEYIQGRWQLREVDNIGQKCFCCLGVLCDIYKNETGKGDWSQTGFVLEGQVHIHYLPWEVAEWAGLDSVKPQVGGTPLATLNDQPYKYDIDPGFKGIAEKIEQHL